MTREAFEHAASTLANKATVSGVVTSFVGTVADSGPTFWVGTFIGIAGLLVNLIYKHRDDRRKDAEDRRKEAEHRRKMSQSKW